MSTRVIEISAVAAMLVATPILACAQSVAYGTSPVSITACSVSTSFDATASGGPYSFGTGLPRMTNDLALTYVNKGNVPATAITFAVKDGARTESIVAKGSFAPGIPIERTFAADATAGPRDRGACSVAQVDFADGSVWHAPHRDVVTR